MSVSEQKTGLYGAKASVCGCFWDPRGCRRLPFCHFLEPASHTQPARFSCLYWLAGCQWGQAGGRSVSAREPQKCGTRPPPATYHLPSCTPVCPTVGACSQRLTIRGAGRTCPFLQKLKPAGPRLVCTPSAWSDATSGGTGGPSLHFGALQAVSRRGELVTGHADPRSRETRYVRGRPQTHWPHSCSLHGRRRHLSSVCQPDGQQRPPACRLQPLWTGKCRHSLPRAYIQLRRRGSR